MYLEIKDVKKSYGEDGSFVQVLNGVTTEVEHGEMCVIQGTSGSGKSTLLNCIGGLDTMDSGSVKVAGTEIFGMKKEDLLEYRRANLGFIFQFYNLVPNLTALENVELASEISHTKLDAFDVLCSVGLKDRVGNFPAQLSGGEQQRVSIARALAKEPKLLLCDEPTGALDYQTGKNILDLLHDTCRKSGMTVIVITHNSALTKMADRVIRIKNGSIVSCEKNPSPVPVSEIEW